MLKEMNKMTLEKMSARPKGVGAAPLLAVGALLAAIAAFMLFSTAMALGILVFGAAAALLVYARHRRRRVVPVRYDLQGDEATHFVDVRRACKALAESEKMWRVEDGPETLRAPTRQVGVAVQDPPGIRTNVDAWRLDLGDSQLYFMPDTLLLHQDERYRAISYASFDVAFGPEYRVEVGGAPSDADIVGHTWQHVREDGRPDLRFSLNPRLDQVMYGLLELSGSGFKVRLRVSSRNAAMRFARALGKERNVYQDEGRIRNLGGERISRTTEEEMRVEMAYGILGLQAGSPRDQVTAAYRKLAKIHHPDLLHDLEPEARELAESRMRVINDAYSSLKRQAR
jgi:hypothetical protein